jgi:hypothetical protein
VAGKTVEEKVGEWKTAFDAVAGELHTPGMLDLLATLQSTEGMRDLPLYIQLARIVNANQRAAGTIAALLVATGIKPTAVNYGDDE